jgi:hypothetical protein
MTEVPQETWNKSGSRLLWRLRNITFQNGFTFEALRLLLANDEYKSVWSQSAPQPIKFFEKNYLSRKLVNTWKHTNLNGPDPEGVWTSSIWAEIQVPLPYPISECKVFIGFSSASRENVVSQRVSISVNDVILFKDRSFHGWTMTEASGTIKSATDINLIVLRLVCDRTVCTRDFGDGDERHLGVYVSWITCNPIDDHSAPPDSETSEIDDSQKEFNKRQLVMDRAADREARRAAYNRDQDLKGPAKQTVVAQKWALDEVGAPEEHKNSLFKAWRRLLELLRLS